MKLNILILTIGIILGGYFFRKYYPITIEKPIEVVKTDIKTKVVTREVVLPNGQIERESVTVTDSKIETQSKVPPKYHITLQKRLTMAGQNDVYSIFLNRRIYDNFYLSAGINTEKQVSVGLGIEF